MNLGRRLDGHPAVGIDIFKERNANLVDVSERVPERDRTDPSGGGPARRPDQDHRGPGRERHQLADGPRRGRRHRPAAVDRRAVLLPAPLAVHADGDPLAIPICFVMTLGFMYFAGVTLNILSMMGLLLAVGMLVDNAVVVVESIYQERERLPGSRAGFDHRHAPRRHRLSAGTLCHCIVFVPNLFGERT